MALDRLLKPIVDVRKEESVGVVPGLASSSNLNSQSIAYQAVGEG